MIHPIKRDQYWSFWYQGWSNHQVQELPWWNEAVEVIEATEVVEAVEVIQAAEVSNAKEITHYVKWMLFLLLEAKEAVEVIEAAKVFHARKSLTM